MTAPLVSVVIPVFNRPGQVVRAVDSVLGQTFPDFELIVVDDGSDDDTPAALEPYRDRIRLFAQAHRGVSAARNLGIEKARGRLIAFLDSDDYWRPEKLARQVIFFEEHPAAMLCQTEEVWIRNGLPLTPEPKHKKPSGQAFFRCLELCLISPSAVMMRKELLDEVGLFDVDLPAAEDYDLWLRVTARYPVWLIDEPLIIKTGGHPDQLSRTTVGLDRHRVRALEKILASGVLSPEQAAAAATVLARKAEIYGMGCLKRGKTEEGRTYLELAERARGQACDGSEPGRCG